MKYSPQHPTETEAFYFGSSGSMGQVMMTWKTPRDRTDDVIAMLFMTSQGSGTLVRMESEISSDFFEISLVGWLVCLLVGWLDGLFVGWLVGWMGVLLVGWMAG